MILLACLGADRCQRDFRSLSCRQFPFFPYVTSDYRFIGMAYAWEFEERCWVVSNLQRVTQKYRDEFMQTYDAIFALFQDEFENYVYHSERLRIFYKKKSRWFVLLHRNGGCYRISPKTERMRRIRASSMQPHGFYQG